MAGIQAIAYARAGHALPVKPTIDGGARVGKGEHGREEDEVGQESAGVPHR